MLRRFKGVLSRSLCGHHSANDDGFDPAELEIGRDINDKPIEGFAEHPAVRPLKARRIPPSSGPANAFRPLTPPTTPPRHTQDTPGQTRPSRDTVSSSRQPRLHEKPSRQTFTRWDTGSSIELGWTSQPSQNAQIDQSARATASSDNRNMLSATSSMPRLPEPDFPSPAIDLGNSHTKSDVSVDHVAHAQPAVTEEDIRPHVHTIYHPVRTRSIHIHEHRLLIQPIIVPASPTEPKHYS